MGRLIDWLASHPVILVVVWLVPFFVALALGSYRNRCVILEERFGRITTPPIWGSRVFRVASWIIVAVFSLWYASVSLFIINAPLRTLFWPIYFGGYLALRWQLSVLFAFAWVKWKKLI